MAWQSETADVRAQDSGAIAGPKYYVSEGNRLLTSAILPIMNEQAFCKNKSAHPRNKPAAPRLVGI
jgi:hypothetical protein